MTFTESERVLLWTMEREGTIDVLWPNGAAYIREDDGTLIACGVEALVPADPSVRIKAIK